MTNAGIAIRYAVLAGRILSPGFAWRLGGLLGYGFGCLPGREQRRCREHLARAFPDRDRLWINHTARKTFRSFGRMALWTLSTLHRDPRDLRRRIAIEGREHFRATIAASRRGEGTMVVSAHLGNWELLARVVSTFLPISVVGKRLRNPDVDAFVAGLRTNPSSQVIYQDDGIRPCIDALKSGRICATLPDQDVPRLAGVFVPWFGHPAYTPSGPAALALLSRCPLQPAYLYERGGRWVLHWGPRRTFTRTDDRKAAIAEITEWYTAYQESLVRRVPHQWAWWHKRWRTQPH